MCLVCFFVNVHTRTVPCIHPLITRRWKWPGNKSTAREENRLYQLFLTIKWRGCELTRKCCRQCVELYRRNTISVVCLSSRAFISNVEKMGYLRFAGSARTPSLCDCQKDQLSSVNADCWLLTNFSRDFAKRLLGEIRRYFWCLETCSRPFRLSWKREWLMGADWSE